MFLIYLQEIGKTILESQTIAITFGALIAGYVAFSSYRKQKERENIETYLK